jgi:hypothetical protein
MKRKGVLPNKRRRTRGGATSITRNAASGVIEIPDDDPADVTQMYLSSISKIERMNSIKFGEIIQPMQNNDAILPHTPPPNRIRPNQIL